MTVYPIEWQPVAATGYYRHLQRRDVETWERFIGKHGTEWDAVAYDVAVGGLEPQLENLSDAERTGWRYTTALKIDVLLKRGPLLTVAEVKPSGSVSALGAALCYPRLLAREHPALELQGGAVICGSTTPDFEWLAQQLNIAVYVV